MQQQQPGTVTHSHTCISSLLISRRFTRPRVALRFQFRHLHAGSGRGSPKVFRCNLPFWISKSATGNTGRAYLPVVIWVAGTTVTSQDSEFSHPDNHLWQWRRTDWYQCAVISFKTCSLVTCCEYTTKIDLACYSTFSHHTAWVYL